MEQEQQDKELYAFEVKTTKEVEEKTPSKNDKGEEVVTITKVKKEVPVRIVIRRPTRRQIEKADLEYTIKLSELMKLGILTRAMVTKKYADTGGVLTESEALYLTSRYRRLAEIQKDFVNLSLNATNLDEVAKKKLDEVTEEINRIRREIATVEANYSFIFQHTSDVRAQNHVILWYSIMLSYIQDEKDGKPQLTSLFKGDSFEERLEDFYRKEEDPDLFYLQVKQKLSYFITYWYNGAIASKEDFVKLEKELETNAS